MMKNEKIYFPNLNGLRFIAAFLVLIHHIEQIKSIYNIPNYWEKVPFIRLGGKLGVVLFFVLSGFLITYLLLSEEKIFKDINIKKFYMRRILRIWPLYFLIIFLALFIFPNVDIFIMSGFSKEVIYDNFGWKFLLFLLICPNLVISAFGVVPYASHTWSIGTEEQFYLIWPLIIKYVKKKREMLMLFIIGLYMFIKHLSIYLSIKGYIPELYGELFNKFLLTFPVDCMAIGAFYSVLLFQKSKYLKYLIRNDLFYISIIFVVICMIMGVHIPYLHYEFYAVFFGIIILNFSANKNINISLENRYFNYLGNISYGLYMYHPICIVFTIFIATKLSLETNYFIYPFTLFLTILIAGLSYKYFEKYFLMFKKKFTKVLSGS